MIESWFLLFVVMATGTILAYYQYWYLATFLITVVLAVGLFKKQYFNQLIVAVLVLLATMLYFNMKTVIVPDTLPRVNNAIFTGIVKTIPEYDGQKSSFVLHTESQKPYEKNLQVFCQFDSQLNKGDRVFIRGDMKVPEKPGNPGEFNYAQYLSHQQVYYVFSINEKKNIELISQGSGWQKWLSSHRERGEKLIYDLLPEDEAGILIGMLFGNKCGIDEKQYQDFQKTGIVHIFAVSGLHVGFLLLFCAGLTYFFNISRRSFFFFSIVLIFLYGSITGWPVSVQRASIMASLGLLAYYTGREKQLLNSLGLAGIIILIIDPHAVFKISFQLSFVAAWGLVYLFPLIKSRLNYESKLWDLILIPVCAQIAVIPLIAYHFNLFTPVALVSNVLITYLAACIVILGFISLFSSAFFAVLASPFLLFAGMLAEVLLFMTAIFNDLPFAYLWAATPSFLLISIYYAGLLLWIGYMKGLMPKPAIILAFLMMAVFLVVISLPAGVFNRGQMEGIFIDVGQGDGILIKTARGKFILIDGGGSEFSDVGSRKVLPYLRHRGIREIFMLVNTHPDTDHLQGLETVAEEIPARFIAIPASLFQAERYDLLKETAEENSIPIVALESGQELNIEEDLEIRVLYPEGEDYQGNDYNDQSLVLRIQYGDFSLLLTGDLENEGLQGLLANTKKVKSTVVKVPHHGSRGSLLPEFYEKTMPHWAVVSAGRNNLFGHPHQDVLNALGDRGIEVLRTDTQGAITISTDGRMVEISTYR